MALSKAFAKAKYYGGVVKDTFANMGDAIMAGQEIQGNTLAGVKVDADKIMKDSQERNKTRRALRRASKPV